MKTIGLIGGMSWESSAQYYRMINEEIRRELGGLHSAKCILYSVNFEEIEHFQKEGQWEKAGSVLGDAAKSLEKAGADLIILCTNTMHRVSDYIEEATSIPLLHIADGTGARIKDSGLGTVGLLGTKYTMEQEFYKSRLVEEFGLKVIVPNEAEREQVNKIIFDELCMGIIAQDSKEFFLEVMKKLAKAGAEGIILGCTEIGLLVKQADLDIRLFDTTHIHAVEAVKRALEDCEKTTKKGTR